MIREFKTDDLETIMGIWIRANMEAHHFIPRSYWHKNYDVVNRMLPEARIFVYEDDDIIRGFVGLNDNYIAGIFVDQEHQSQGIGKSLLNHIKANHSQLSLHVYKKNVRAVKFYQRESFTVLNEQIDVNTGQIELVMKWERSAPMCTDT